MAQKPSIPKGTRDFSPEEVLRRNYIINTLRHNFELFGFQPIETPSFENSSTLMGKYGDEGDRLIFKILNSGDYFKNMNFILKANLVLHRYFLNEILFQDFYNDYVIEHNKHSKKIVIPNRGQDFTEEDKSLIQNLFESQLSDWKYNKWSTIEQSEKNFLLAIRDNFLDTIFNTLLVVLQIFENEDGSNLQAQFERLIQEILYKNYFNKLTSEISEKALRYDLTVPFARYVVQHQNEIEFPFKRYQIQPVWRADRPQKGRFREFFQCDADAVGSQSLLQEVTFVQLYDAVFTDLGLKGTTVKMNNRKILSGLAETIGASDKLIDFTVALDKLDKIGEEGVITEMLSKGITAEAIERVKPIFKVSGSFAEKLSVLKELLADSEIGKQGIEELQYINEKIEALGLKTVTLDLDVTLARGLNYYTGAIFEVAAPKGVQMGSIGGGGRYDDLTGIFGLKDVSGVGISFGLDRIYLVLEELNLFPEQAIKGTRLLFLNFGENEALYCLKAVQSLREAGIIAELYPDSAKMKKQMSHADKRNIKFVVLAGTQEMAEGVYTLKDMKTGNQKRLDLQGVIDALA